MIEDEKHFSQLRLFLEELCSDLCRFEYATGPKSPKDVSIDREFDLGRPGVYADLRVSAPGKSPFFLEVKYGYPDSQLLQRVRSKYGTAPPGGQMASKLVLVVDAAKRPGWTALEQKI